MSTVHCCFVLRGRGLGGGGGTHTQRVGGGGRHTEGGETHREVGGGVERQKAWVS